MSRKAKEEWLSSLLAMDSCYHCVTRQMLLHNYGGEPESFCSYYCIFSVTACNVNSGINVCML